jgi:uncharacterized membrane protein YfcA
VYIQNKQIDWKKSLPLIAVSVPMAYAGAAMRLSQDTFFILLGCSLLVAGLLLWIRQGRLGDEDQKAPGKGNSGNLYIYLYQLVMGGAIGFLSGMVGIGGGIFLSPLLNLLRWDTPKKIAATASLFILVNSISGIAGQLHQLPSNLDLKTVGILAGAVLIGGQLGSRIGTLRFNHTIVRRVTALLVFAAGIEVLYRHLPWWK